MLCVLLVLWTDGIFNLKEAGLSFHILIPQEGLVSSLIGQSKRGINETPCHAGI